MSRPQTMVYEGEEYEIEWFTPRDYNYKDRGMIKWMGMMLSDHSEALIELEKEEREAEPHGKEKHTMEEVSKLLFKAYYTNQPVKIQADFLKNGSYYKDVECKVVGHNGEDKVYLKLKDGDLRAVGIKYIRNIERMNNLEWYGKIGRQ
ncbi:hypothetical protein [Marinilactibacillus psychrotolerans]|uniref:hypothetical protein n=1 Tax=Marinilactibacillus psychrotolerans TaxID=191770 RepID=UPI0038860115